MSSRTGEIEANGAIERSDHGSQDQSRADVHSREPVVGARLLLAESRSSDIPDDLVCVKPAHLGKLLDMSKSKIYQAIARGEIRIVRIAGCIRVTAAEVRRLLGEAR